MLYTTFSSGSFDFIKYIQLSNKTLIGVSGGSIRVSPSAYILAYAKLFSYKIYHYMYYRDGLISLNRKRTKLISFIAVDGTDILNGQRASGETVNTLV